VTEDTSGVGAELGSQDAIELRLAATLEHLPIIRSLAASIAIRADFDLDSIADLKLAVDEAASTLITHAAPGSTLVCTFAVGPDEFRFTAVSRSTSDEQPSRESFGWRVLSTLTDHATSWIEKDASTINGDGTFLHIELAKRKTAGIA
jgi:serine/threonine-protein kinase RsbW